MIEGDKDSIPGLESASRSSQSGLRPSLLTGEGSIEVKPLSKITKGLLLSGILSFSINQANFLLAWRDEIIATSSVIATTIFLLGAFAHAEWRGHNLSSARAIEGIRSRFISRFLK